MTCLNPYIVSIGLAFGCGRCFFCRSKKAKEWTHRIILEASQHADNSFVTLTYSDEYIPAGGTLVPSDLQLFLKRLRFSISPAKIRFFAVGEYGDNTRRPHYHLALFGYPSCAAPLVRNGKTCRCTNCVGIARAWSVDGISLGFISNGTLEPSSAGYIAAYATKSMEKTDADKITPPGCLPPFSRQSNRPGIGAAICDDIADVLLRNNCNGMDTLPLYLEHGKGSRRPLGRYLRSKIRERIGISKDDATRYGLEQLEKKMLPLRQIALMAPPGTREITFKEELVKAYDNKRLQITTRRKIYKQVKKL